MCYPRPSPERSLPTLPPAMRHHDYRVLWIGQAISSVGSQFTTVAMAWQVYELTNSPLQIGLIGLSRAIPQMALLLFGGLLADAVDRRRLIVVTQLGLFGVAFSLMAVTAMGQMTPLILYL